jgi:hypothetical protein
VTDADILDTLTETKFPSGLHGFKPHQREKAIDYFANNNITGKQ